MIGSRLGQYRIDALLGQGGMGTVYLATDEMLGRQVAVKVLRLDVTASPTTLERFRKEAQILARLDHPHILRLHGFSRHEDLLYMVTHYVEGDSLLRLLERQSVVELPQALAWAREILDALEYAHAAGIVHRDIKPGNILIDQRGRVQLLDFGIARLVEDDSLTQTGHAVGTLAYMAPEQVLGETVDGRADLYAFAIVFCQMLAGRRPWRSTTAAGVVREIVDGPAPEVAALLPAVAAPFVPILQQTLSRRPEDRPPTAAHLREALDATARAAGIVVPPTPSSGAVPVSPVPGGRASMASSSASIPVFAPTASATTVTVPPPVAARPHAPRWLPISGGLLLCVALALGWTMTRRPSSSPPSPEAQTTHMGADAGPSTPSTPATDPAPVPLAAPSPDQSPMRQAPDVVRPTAVAPSPRPSATPDSAVRVARGADQASPAVAERAEIDGEAAPAATPRASGSTAGVAEFRNLILVDKVDDENEEFDVHLRFERRRLIVLDEDEVPMKTTSVDAIRGASYRTTKPGRFSLRRGLRHWLTLDTSSGQLVFRLNSRSYSELLDALESRGVDVVGAP